MSLAKSARQGTDQSRFSSVVEQISGEGARAWEIHFVASQRFAAGQDILRLTIGDHDFDAPTAAIEATVAALRSGRHHYTRAGGELPLRDAVARWQSKLNGQRLSQENVVVLPGAQSALYTGARCLFQAGDSIIVPDPMYATYEATLRASGAEVRRVPLHPENGWRLDPQDVAHAIDNSVRGIVLTSPHNPTGALIDADSLDAIAQLARDHDLWIISDEVYAAMVYEGEHQSIATLPGMSDRTLVLGSLSKSHAMPGWRIGWGAGPADLIEHMIQLSSCMFFGQPPFAQDGALEAIESSADTAVWIRDLYRERRDRFCDQVAKIPRLSFQRPAAGMFVMLDVRQTGVSAKDFAWGLLDAEGLALMPGEGFGDMGKGHLRVSLSVDTDTIDDAVARLARYTGKLA